MSSVTVRIKEVKQPRGGYIKQSQFAKFVYDDGNILGEENIHASIIGTAVDYLTRFMTETDVKEAFAIPIIGYMTRIGILGSKKIREDSRKGIALEQLLDKIKGLDNNSIIAACQLCTYDVWKRNPLEAAMARGADEVMPDGQTIENIRIMVNRSISFWNKYGPVTVSGFTFEGGGYTETVDSGDGDYLTEDTLWDFKVSKSQPTSKHTLQLLMYWIMGQHSGKEEFKKLTHLGIFNPRLNTVYRLDMCSVPEEVIHTVEKEVIGY